MVVSTVVQVNTTRWKIVSLRRPPALGLGTAHHKFLSGRDLAGPVGSYVAHLRDRVLGKRVACAIHSLSKCVVIVVETGQADEQKDFQFGRRDTQQPVFHRQLTSVQVLLGE